MSFSKKNEIKKKRKKKEKEKEKKKEIVVPNELNRFFQHCKMSLIPSIFF
jgi:hypothetical protein